MWKMAHTWDGKERVPLLDLSEGLVLVRVQHCVQVCEDGSLTESFALNWLKRQ